MGEVDWQVVAAAIGIFITTVYTAWRGWRDKREEKQSSTPLAIFQDAAIAREQVTEMTRLNHNLETVSAQLTRITDIIIMLGSRRDL